MKRYSINHFDFVLSKNSSNQWTVSITDNQSHVNVNPVFEDEASALREILSYADPDCDD